MALHIDEIRNKYNAGEYTYKPSSAQALYKFPCGHIFDEELSVKRNRELVKEHNDKVDQMYQDRTKKQAKLNKKLTEDIVAYIMDSYDLTEAQARAVESFVYREHHSFMCDYFSYIDTFADFADDLVNCAE